MQVVFIFCHFSLIRLISIWCKPSFEIKFDQLGKVTMLFWCVGGCYPSPYLTKVPDVTLIRVKWEKFQLPKFDNFFLKKRFTKIVFLLNFFYIFVNFQVSDNIFKPAVPHILRTNVRDLLNLSQFGWIKN